MYISRCWLCWGVIDPLGSVLNLDMFSLFLVNKELLSLYEYICMLVSGGGGEARLVLSHISCSWEVVDGGPGPPLD